jgi:hypothetical protein
MLEYSLRTYKSLIGRDGWMDGRVGPFVAVTTLSINRVVTVADGPTCPSVTSDKALVRPFRNIRAYSSIF